MEYTTIKKSMGFYFLKYFFCFLFIFFIIQKTNAGTLVWPTRLSIKNNEKNTAIWLENKDNNVKTIQVRVFRWEQINGKNELIKQNSVVGSPPIANIDPGNKQLIRLVNLKPAENEKELTYRVIIDEIPRNDFAKTNLKNEEISPGIRFQMRYSIPLFIYGKGLNEKIIDEKKSEKILTNIKNQLNWRVINIEGKNWLEINNKNNIHVHLRKMKFLSKDSTKNVDLSDYILANSTMRWILPVKIDPKSKLIAELDSADLIEIPQLK